ncbi:hypothetical protein BBW65_04795 [Helicobacter enhydrae]|uniref:Uncharacterized protein n=1 Tax=Helicobacter enhydrae TaxID=222136 RepID=A0A1B1U5X3_9HELI|nr:hypothetical protein [Helicobacter enhydrae]ANV98159.1 hypothetical protein BBW65_04795 [Helicobacter enhydrae]
MSLLGFILFILLLPYIIFGIYIIIGIISGAYTAGQNFLTSVYGKLILLILAFIIFHRIGT